MTRTRKLTLTMKEFSHLVSESLDIANAAPPPQSLIDNPALFSESPKKTHHHRPSSFQRIFFRPTSTPGQREDFPQSPPEDPPESPRKMIAWPFTRSPRKNRPTKEEDNTTEVEPETYRMDGEGASPYYASSPAAASTSSLGSLVPAHERLFQVIDEQNCHVFRVSCSSPVTIIPPLASGPPTSLGYYAPLEAIFGNGSTTSVLTSSTVEPISGIGISSQENEIRPIFEGTASLSVANTERESFDEDPTPRASTFGSCAGRPSVANRNNSRGRLSLAAPSRNVEVFASRPAMGVAPQAPSETESSVSVCSTSPPPSPVGRTSSPTFPMMKPPESGNPLPHVPLTPSSVRVSALSSSIASSSNLESISPLGYSPRQRKRAMSRSLTPPPLPRPPPTGPLPAVPPVPPLPPLPSKMSMNMSPVSSPSRPTISGAQTNPAAALPPLHPGGLRLPSRLSWVNSVRAVLPSPPASPTKSFKSFAGKMPLPISPSKAELKRPNELKRPTSIGVIEAADNIQVRRTKSILLLGSRSKSNASLGTKRVQIHADANLDPNPNPKPRRKSSAATVGHPPFSSHSGPGITSMQSPELLVPRERRHSAPVLSSMDSRPTGASVDWTLSLPFYTDVPGHQILESPSHTPQLKSEQNVEEVQREDWTLCMPLKVRAGTPTVESVEAADTECTFSETVEVVETHHAVQLPTPSPSPTLSTPVSVVCSLDPEENEPLPEERPASPASLGPHVGGLDLAGGRGKRASGWHVYGWFDEVSLSEEDEQEVVPPTPATPATNSECKFVKSHIAVFRKMHDAAGRHPSQDSMSTVSTTSATFYSARSSLLVN